MSTYRASPAFRADDLRRFFGAVDRHLTRHTRIEIIGGCAAALAHGATSATTDVDTFTPTTTALQTADTAALGVPPLDRTAKTHST